MNLSRLALSASALAVAMVAAACVDIGVGTALPTGPAQPTTPAATSGQAGPTQPPPAQTGTPLATIPPVEQPEGNLCHILTTDEISGVAGGALVVLGEDYDLPGECNWDVGAPNELGTPDAFLNFRRDFGNALTDARELFPGGEDVAIGDDAYWMPDLRVLNFAKNGSVYAVQVVVVDSDMIDARGLAFGVGEIAAGRV